MLLRLFLMKQKHISLLKKTYKKKSLAKKKDQEQEKIFCWTVWPLKMISGLLYLSVGRAYKVLHYKMAIALKTVFCETAPTVWCYFWSLLQHGAQRHIPKMA